VRYRGACAVVPVFSSVNRDRDGIYLCRGGQGRGSAWVWVGVEDATKLHEEFVARGVAMFAPDVHPACIVRIP